MKEFFRKQPLKVKLFLLGIIPLLFITYLTWQIYIEKDSRIKIVDTLKWRIAQTEQIIILINELQKEEKASYDYLNAKISLAQFFAQTKKTDSTLQQLKRLKFGVLKSFEKYTGLLQLNNMREQVILRQTVPGKINHYYSSTSFRLNSLNGLPYGSLPELNNVYGDMQAQKILTEQITYLGIIKTNIYNILLNRKNIPEALLSSYGAYEALLSYEVEFKEKAAVPTLKEYNEINSNHDVRATYAILTRAFTNFNIDSNLNADTWWNVSGNTQEHLMTFRRKIWNNVNHNLEDITNTLRYNKNRAIIAVIVFAILLFSFIGYTITVITKMINELKNGALTIAEGKSGVYFNIHSKDAIGSLAKSITELDENNKQIVTAARKIGDGNFNVEVKARSEDDQLANALTNMKSNLEQSIKSLRSSEQRFKQLTDLIPQIVWSSGNDGRPVYYNQKWFEYAGDNPLWNILHPDEQDLIVRSWKESVKENKPFSIEIRLRNHASNEYRWFLVRAVPLKTEDEQATRWFGTSTDIHDQKTLHEKLERLVAQRTNELKLSNDDLLQFAHVASHDMKEPLRKIRIYTDMLLNEPDINENSRILNYSLKINKAAERLTQLIDGILKFSSIEDKDEEITDFNLTNIVHDITTDLEIIISQKQARLQYDHLPVLRANKVLFTQLMYNLISNALKFTAEKETPNIIIESSIVRNTGVKEWSIPSNDYLQIKISDNGIGFDEVFANKIFEVFARIHDRNKYEGTGLGLALCKKIVERHGGYIYAKSAENNGAKFIMLFPLTILSNIDSQINNGVEERNTGIKI